MQNEGRGQAGVGPGGRDVMATGPLLQGPRACLARELMTADQVIPDGLWFKVPFLGQKL